MPQLGKPCCGIEKILGGNPYMVLLLIEREDGFIATDVADFDAEGLLP